MQQQTEGVYNMMGLTSEAILLSMMTFYFGVKLYWMFI